MSGPFIFHSGPCLYVWHMFAILPDTFNLSESTDTLYNPLQYLQYPDPLKRNSLSPGQGQLFFYYYSAQMSPPGEVDPDLELLCCCVHSHTSWTLHHSTSQKGDHPLTY